MKQIELYDVGRTLIKPLKQGYGFIAEHGDRYINDRESLERIRAFHNDRSIKLTQKDFDILSYAWAEAIKDGGMVVNPSELVYADVKPRFDKVRARGHNVVLHTSGSKELTHLLVGDEFGFDDILLAEDTGDKNSPETFAALWEYTEGGILAFYDDKASVIDAAYEGFRSVSANLGIYLVDRTDTVNQEKVKELASKGIPKIKSFNEIND